MGRKLKRVTVKNGRLLTKTLNKLEKGVTQRLTRELQKAATPTTTAAESPQEEKLKTSFYLTHTIVARAKAAARVLGISLNAYASTALVEKIMRDARLSAAPSPADPHSDHARSRLLTPRAVSFHPTLRSVWSQSSGFTFKSDTDSEPDGHATWEQVQKFAERQAAHPDHNWMRIGRVLGFDEPTARAAEYAVSSGAWDEYQREAERAQTRS